MIVVGRFAIGIGNEADALLGVAVEELKLRSEIFAFIALASDEAIAEVVDANELAGGIELFDDLADASGVVVVDEVVFF